VELHGGTIEAHSEGRERGATFVITLRAAAADASAAAAPIRVPAQSETPLSGVRVLVVDDDPGTLEMLTTVLETTGAKVRAADSARGALERLRAEGADVIVSDIAMPGEDGFWLMQRVRELPGDRGRTPAIALTALARREDRERAFEAGYQIHVAKPVEWSELRTGLATLLSERPAPPDSHVSH
jgi:CheY-like chemotaxis protein